MTAADFWGRSPRPAGAAVGLGGRLGRRPAAKGEIVPLDRKLVFPHLLAARAEETPDGVYLQRVEGGELTYAQTSEAALRWADAFRRLGVGRGDTVASMLPTGFDPFVCWVGLNWLVAWEVPVNTAYQGRMLSYTLEDSGARVGVFAERYLPRLAAIVGDTGRLETVVVPDATGPLPDLPFRVVTGPEFLADATPARDLDGPEPHDVTEIFYTSGTTGPSKGVLYTHAQMHASTVPLNEAMGPDDAFYAPFPTYHVSGKVFAYSSLVTRSRLVVREVFSTDAFWDDIARFRCTNTLLLGAMANFVFRQPEHPAEKASPLDKVLMVPLIPELAEFKARFGVRVSTVFNMTETSSPIVAGYDDDVPTASCGRVRAGYECRVVDENDYEVPPGELGELVVRADEPWVLNAGYFNKAPQTAAAWRNGWFHTGDGFTYDEDGLFYFVDRKKDAIRRRGENISSMEVEAEVNEHPDVLESAAVAVASEWGEDEVKVVVVPKPGAALAPEDLVAFLEPRMARFMLPRYVELVDALPKTPTEKVRKVELREAGVNERTWDRQASAAAPRRG